MNRKNVLLAFVAGFLMTACGEETRNGWLDLIGSEPVRISDESGRIVSFVSGPLKVEFGGSGRKFSVTLEQAGNKAKLSGKAPEASDWNFTLRGRDIGQLVDITSRRSVELYGEVSTSIGSGGPCGFDGRWVTEEQWRKGNEDWRVAFTDAGSTRGIANFKSRREGYSYLVGSRNLYCREQHRGEPGGGRWGRLSNNISRMSENGVRFD